MKLPKILSLKCNHAKMAAFKIDWSNWVVCYCSKHNYDCFSGLKIAVLLHSFKCFFNVGKQIRGYECPFLDLVGGGCAKWDVCENSLQSIGDIAVYKHCFCYSNM